MLVCVFYWLNFAYDGILTNRLYKNSLKHCGYSLFITTFIFRCFVVFFNVGHCESGEGARTGGDLHVQLMSFRAQSESRLDAVWRLAAVQSVSFSQPWISALWVSLRRRKLFTYSDFRERIACGLFHAAFSLFSTSPSAVIILKGPDTLFRSELKDLHLTFRRNLLRLLVEKKEMCLLDEFYTRLCN